MDVFKKMQADVDAMPLYTWLKSVKAAYAMSGDVESLQHEIARMYVEGLNKRGLMYHFDDCALDCLGKKCDVWECDLINELTSMMAHHDLCAFGIEELEKENGVVHTVPVVDTDIHVRHACHCDIKDLATWGCKCGGV